MRCKWLSDDFSEICVNGDCPVCGDWCVCANYPEICRYAEDERGDAMGKWISVKDALPQDQGWYLVYAPSYSGGSSSGLKCINGVMFAKWNGKAWSIEVGYYKRSGCVKHWMPFPEAPKEG